MDIYKSNEFAYTAPGDRRYLMDYYNLDEIISIGYRGKSLRGTQFRVWVTDIIKECMDKGSAMKDERLNNTGGSNGAKEDSGIKS